jgi:hypothetical protein
MEIKYCPKIILKTLTTNDSMNDLDPTNAPKIQKLELGVRKPRRSDIKWSNPYGDQATHFNDYTESPSLENSSYNHIKIRATFNVRFIICVSLPTKGKHK